LDLKLVSQGAQHSVPFFTDEDLEAQAEWNHIIGLLQKIMKKMVSTKPALPYLTKTGWPH
jgi:hypothetical protein